MTIIKYQNGNCLIEIHEDGTKIRQWDGIAKPEFPESIDLKITDYCDAGCYYCHESSTRKGKHCDINTVKSIIHGLPSGVELAIGGGNPLSHPNLVHILQIIKSRGLIANLTVNSLHIDGFYKEIVSLRDTKLISGLGISYNKNCLNDIIKICNKNTVIHLISGIHEPVDAFQLLENQTKMLILGYKIFGFGKKYDQIEVMDKISAWKRCIGSIIRNKNSVVSFDNLAIRQLEIQKLLSPTIWNEFYMGDDGKFTMYVDAVKKEFAVSSTSERFPILNKNIREMFQVVNLQANKNNILSVL